MRHTDQVSANIALVPTGALFGAIIGGIIWAIYIQLTGLTAWWVEIAIGMLTGIGAVLTSHCRRISIASVAALFAIPGILMGKYLDVRWNAPRTAGLIEAHEAIPPSTPKAVLSMRRAKLVVQRGNLCASEWNGSICGTTRLLALLRFV